MTPAQDWALAVARYRVPTRLTTRARRAGFTVVAIRGVLRITPDSTGRPRDLTRSDFERSVPLLGHVGRGEVNDASRNSSYVEAILLDIRP